MARRALPEVVVVGLGPAGEEHRSARAALELSSDRPLYVRTARHPGTEELAMKGAIFLDHHYEEATSFEAAYAGIVEEVVAAAIEKGAVTYAVPGSPFVGESTVTRLSKDARVRVEIVASLSFVELAYARLSIDPLEARVRLIDGESFATEAAGETGALLVAQTYSRRILSDMKAALSLDDSMRAVVLHHLGLKDEVVVEVALSELDTTLEPDHLTAVYLAEVARPVHHELARLIEVVSVLRRACPWDAEQTHQSLGRHLLEETYETLEAIEELGLSGDHEHLVEELGDVLCQVLYHAKIGSESGRFGLDEISETARDKLVSRHPHVFSGRPGLDSAERVVAAWEELKRKEKGRDSVMDGIPAALPALLYATKIERKAHAAGLGVEVTGAKDDLLTTAAATPDELGELLLLVARRGAAAGMDPEEALRRSATRFKERFVAAERRARDAGSSLPELALKERLELF